MSQTDGFEQLVEGLFSDAELAGLRELACRPYALEPALVGREVLLDYFNDFLNLVKNVTDPTWKKIIIDRFLSNIASVTDMRGNEPVHIKRVTLYMKAVGEHEYYNNFLPESVDINGNFCGFTIAPWYELPAELPDDPEPYRRQYGLMVMLENPTITDFEGVIETLEGVVLVPLNYGSPELFHRISPSNN